MMRSPMVVKALSVGAWCLLLIGCASDSDAVAPTRRAFVEACSEVVCRPVRYVLMEAEDGTRVEVPVADDPYVYEGRISILTGEAFRVSPTVSQDRIVDLVYLGEIQSPVRTFDLSLDRQGGFVVLEFDNPFSRDVQFQVAARRNGAYQAADQVFCVVRGSQSGTVDWVGGVDAVLIHDVSFAGSAIIPDGRCG